MERETVGRIAQLLRYDDERPPLYVLWAVASLLGIDNAADLPATMQGRFTTDAGATTWYAFALTEENIVTVIASADRAPWTLVTHKQVHTPPDSMSAVVRPRSHVERLEVIAVEDVSTWDDGRMDEWTTGWRIHFADGDTFDLPADRRSNSDELGRKLLAGLTG